MEPKRNVVGDMCDASLRYRRDARAGDGTNPISRHMRHAESQVPEPAAIRLRCISAACHAATAPGVDDALWLESIIDCLLKGQSADLMPGFKPGRDQRAIECRARLDQRNEILCEAGKRFYGNLSVAGQGQRLSSELTAYMRVAWARDRVNDLCPARVAGTVRECLFRALKCHDRFLSPRTLRLILAMR